MAELGKSSQYLGITAQALQELQFAAEKSGVSVDALYNSIKELQVRAFDAKSGEGEAIVLSSETGLLASPEIGSKGKFMVRSLLMAELSAGRKVHIASAVFNGLVTIEKVPLHRL